MKRERVEQLLKRPDYTPNRLLNHVAERLAVRQYNQIAAAIGVERHSLSAVANRRRPVTDSLMIAILDAIPEMTISALRELAGMPRSEL